jgi:hypothetical protein
LEQFFKKEQKLEHFFEIGAIILQNGAKRSKLEQIGVNFSLEHVLEQKEHIGAHFGAVGARSKKEQLEQIGARSKLAKGANWSNSSYYLI